jgi:hypothetical protein
MRKIYLLSAILSLILSQSVFADMDDSSACKKVAHACKAAGYSKEKDMKFWKDCMKPVLYGQTVKNVKVDATDVSTCRTDKIAKMKQEISDLESVK